MKPHPFDELFKAYDLFADTCHPTQYVDFPTWLRDPRHDNELAQAYIDWVASRH